MKIISNVLVLTFAFSSTANANYFVPTCSNSADYTSWGGELNHIAIVIIIAALSLNV